MSWHVAVGKTQAMLLPVSLFHTAQSGREGGKLKLETLVSWIPSNIRRLVVILIAPDGGTLQSWCSPRQLLTPRGVIISHYELHTCWGLFSPGLKSFDSQNGSSVGIRLFKYPQYFKCRGRNIHCEGSVLITISATV